jgi:hypothetical protein
LIYWPYTIFTLVVATYHSEMYCILPRRTKSVPNVLVGIVT